MDADSVLDRHALLRTVQFFLDDKQVIACGGTLRPLNGCRVDEGNLVHDGIPSNPLALCQTVEYMRSFLCGRIGWSQLRALLIISGGYGVFRTDTAVAVGGFDAEMIGEDMDLVLRIHRKMLRERVPYTLAFVPETTCWTEVPETLPVFRNQRARWQRGLVQCLWLHRELFGSLRAPGIGWLAMPFFLVVEFLSPVVEVAGIGVLVYLALSGHLHVDNLLVMSGFALAMSVLLSTTSLLLDSLTPGNRVNLRATATLLLVILIEPFIYHPIHTWYRLVGIGQWLTRKRAAWGTMTRVAKWQTPGKD
jgi:cellulose synthase/poly-beta-1,6-N-acetylglucosamine synthase-like glycosyltransferase